MSDANETEIKKQESKETFSREYVHELREENKNWRLKTQEIETAKRAAEESAAASKREAEEAVSKAMQSASQKIMMAELKASALKAGMVDLDGLKLADLSSIKLSDDGSIEGADSLMEALKEAKPYLFKPVSASSTQTSATPKPETPKAKMATEMTDEEYKKAKADIIKRNR
jgi:hypothetical protein